MKQNNQKKTISLTDIFERWEMDIVESLLIIKERNRYIIVTIDYFSRQSETRLLKVANIDMVVIFLYEEIICRFKALRTL